VQPEAAVTTIAVKHVVFAPDRKGGWVTYELHDGARYSYMKQSFRLGEAGLVDGRHVWGWDGIEPLTLTPSFRCQDGDRHAHLFLTRGQIQLCPDSTVTL
jgi:hypothetical protein